MHQNVHVCRRLIAVSVLVAAIASVEFASAIPAFASGGTSIDSAPIAPLNTAIYGNFATDPLSSDVVTNAGNFSCGEEWWKVPLLVGDTVRITVAAPAGSGETLDDGLFSPGVTDATVFNSNPITWGFSDYQEKVSIPGDTILGIAPDNYQPCQRSNSGPFEFEVAVTHHATVSVPSVFTAVLHRASEVKAIFRYDNGSPVTNTDLKVTLSGRWSQPSYAPPTWHTLATAVPSHGQARLSFVPPSALAGKTCELRVEASGASFAPMHSSLFKLKVAT